VKVSKNSFPLTFQPNSQTFRGFPDNWLPSPSSSLVNGRFPDEPGLTSVFFLRCSRRKPFRIVARAFQVSNASVTALKKLKALTSTSSEDDEMIGSESRAEIGGAQLHRLRFKRRLALAPTVFFHLTNIKFIIPVSVLFLLSRIKMPPGSEGFAP